MRQRPLKTEEGSTVPVALSWKDLTRILLKRQLWNCGLCLFLSLSPHSSLSLFPEGLPPGALLWVHLFPRPSSSTARFRPSHLTSAVAFKLLSPLQAVITGPRDPDTNTLSSCFTSLAGFLQHGDWTKGLELRRTCKAKDAGDVGGQGWEMDTRKPGTQRGSL